MDRIGLDWIGIWGMAWHGMAIDSRFEGAHSRRCGRVLVHIDKHVIYPSDLMISLFLTYVETAACIGATYATSIGWFRNVTAKYKLKAQR